MPGSSPTKEPRAFSLLWAAAAGLALLLIQSRGFLSFISGAPGALGTQTLAALGGHALDLACAALLLAGCAAVGERLSRGSRLAAAALGLPLAGYALLILGLARLYRGPQLAAVWLTLALAGLWRLKDARWRLPRLGLLDLACAAVVFFALLRGAVLAGAPVTDWDSLSYHLALPKLYLLHGAHLRFDWTMTAHYPQTTESLSVMLLALRGGEAAQWLEWLLGAGTLLGVGLLASSFFTPAAAWPAAALFAVQPPFARVLGTAKSDCAAAFALTLALLMFFRGKSGREALLPGLLAGAAAACKHNGLWAAGALAALLLKRGRALAWFVLGAALLGSGWLLRNWVMAGSPLWPFYSGLFGGGPGAAEAAARQLASATGGVERTLLNFLLLPLHVVADPERFTFAPSALVLAFLVLLGLRLAHRKPVAGAPLLFCAAYLAPWFLFWQEGRYLLPVLAVLCALCAGWALELFAEGRQRRFHALALLVLGLSPAAALEANNALYGFLAVRPSDGGEPRRRYLERTLGAPYAAQARANEVLPPDAKVALLYEVRGFYLERDFAYINPLDAGPVDWASLRDGEALRRRLLELGFTHALYNPTLGSYKGDQAYYDHAARLMRELAAGLEAVVSAGPVSVYGLRKVERPSRIMRRTRAAKAR